MDYFVCWQFTKRNSLPYTSQEEIIVSNLIPLVRSKTFQAKVTSFYITRIFLTTVRLQIFTTDEHLEDIQRIIESSTSSLLLYEKNGPNSNPKVVSGYGPPEYEVDFREYLEDITKIGLELLIGDLNLAKGFAVSARFESQPRGTLHPQEILGEHFHDSSEYYRSLERDTNRLIEFWDRFRLHYVNRTPWDHFYYNIVLGADAPPGVSREQFVEAIGLS